MAEGVLGEIVASKAREVAERFDGVSLDALRSSARPTRRSLRAAIARTGARFILEVKKASPSLGAIAVGADPAAVARGYAGVADGLSVLTDARFFGGSQDDLRAARAEFDGPILAKDFFIDPRQVAEARIAGADAVLVMLSVLNDQAAQKMIAEAEMLGMDALVEVHDEEQMRRARGLGARLIGINNRDLRDLSIDLATTERLAALAGGVTVISESGIASRADVDRLARTVDGFLVGSALMNTADPAAAARALMFGRTKLCGLRSAADIAAARAASFAGFVFVPGTPRAITVDEAAPLAALARRSGIVPVGVFRDAPNEAVAEAANALDLGAVQLHGSESAADIAELRRSLPETVEIWTASSVGTTLPASRAGDRTLFDNGSGGTGKTFDWSLIADHPQLDRAIIAGGIGPANAREARALGAYAIDIGSALDQRPGVKSPAKIAALFDALRADSRAEAMICA
ncbi:MAG: bifunctional indole-3-glycerol-phosphate synthase TrpC/phosphoribosylanthranilate isomerase TrpF [Sphingomicrobium sp.]